MASGGRWRRIIAVVGAAVLLAAPLPMLVASPASAATVNVSVPCADGSSAVTASVGDTVYLVGPINPDAGGSCGVASSSTSGAVSGSGYTYTVTGSGEGTINLVSDTGGYHYVIHVNHSDADHPPYPANVGPLAQGPACPWGGHLNAGGDLCIGIDPPPNPSPIPTPTITEDPNAPVPTDPPTAASSAPKPKQRLTPKDVTLVQGPGQNTVNVVDRAGNPLQLLSLSGDTQGVTVVSAGTDFAANASNWAKLGYGDLCWTYSGYSDATGMILPTPTPPFRSIDATWQLSTAILSTASGNVLFRTANPGDIVDAGGRDITAVTICARIKQDESEMRSVVKALPQNKGGTCANGRWCQKNGNNCQGQQNNGHPYQWWYGVCEAPRQLPSVRACEPQGDGTYRPVNVRVDNLEGFTRANPTAIVEPASDPRSGLSFSGQNWFGSNPDTLRNHGCQLPVRPEVQTASATYPPYCLNPNSVNAQTVTGASRVVSVTATGWGDQAVANAEAQRQASAKAQQEVSSGVLPTGAVAGTCPSYSKTTTKEIIQTYCEAGANTTQTFQGTGSATSSVSMKEALTRAQAAADKDAKAQQTQWEVAHPQATAGTCHVYTGTYDPFTIPLTYCKNGVDGTTTLTVAATGTSTVSQTNANSNQIADALAKSVQAKKDWLAQNGATEGTCQRYSVDATYGGTVTYCLNDVTKTRAYSGTVTGVSTTSWFDAADAAKRLANDADAREQSTIPSGATAGKCAPTYSATRSVLEPISYCQAGQTVVDFARGEATVQSRIDQADADQKALAAATTLAQQKAASTPLPGGATAGGCTTYSAPATVSGIAPFCVNGVVTPFPYSQSATATSSTSPGDAYAAALKQATDLVNQDLAARVPAGAIPGQCITYRTNVTVGGSQQYCKVDTTGEFSYQGTGTGTSTLSVNDARVKASFAADQDADRARLAGLPAGATAGRCPPPRVVMIPPTPLPVTGTTTISLPAKKPGFLTGCGVKPKVVNPMPPLVPIPLQSGCVPAVVPTPTADRQKPASSKKPILTVPGVSSPAVTPTPSESSTPAATPAPSQSSSQSSSPAVTPAATPAPSQSSSQSSSPAVTPAATPAPSQSSSQSSSPAVTPAATPAPSQSSSQSPTTPVTDGVVTMVVSNGPSTVTKIVSVSDLLKVAGGGTISDSDGDNASTSGGPSAGGSTDGGLADTGTSLAPLISAALALLGLALLVIPLRRRG